MQEVPPIWIALPEIPASDPCNQGIQAAFIERDWLPYWNTLRPDERATYLDRWNASAEWRAAIAERYEANDDYAAEWHAEQASAPVHTTPFKAFVNRLRSLFA